MAEFLIAIVGPITSIVLGIGFILLANATAAPVEIDVANPQQLIQQLDPLSTLLVWLGPVNILVGIFNMIPGFPLDGGRVLRSIFWVITGNLRRATRYASWIGQGVAWLMIGAGIAMAFGVRIPFLGEGLLNGLWLAFIGWFLNSAAVQSYQQIVVQDVLEGVPVSEMMRTNAPVVTPDITVGILVHEYIMGTDDHAFPVLEGDRLVGLVTLQDVRKVPRENWDQVRVREIMTPEDQLVKVAESADASEAVTKLSQRDVRQIPVVRNGNLVGVLRRQDFVRWMQLQSEETGQHIAHIG
jgi:predicted transcriptional regulator